MSSKLGGLRVRKWFAFVEETEVNETGRKADGAALRKVAIGAAVHNPYAGRFSGNLDRLVKPSQALGAEIGRRLTRLDGGSGFESYGKACIVGMAGEYEHGNALLTSVFADPIRTAIGGGKAWIPSTGKRGGPGTAIDIPLAHKDALYVRSHYDTFTLQFVDAPGLDEVVVIFAVASRGRLHARLGGLQSSKIAGRDGLR
jgi:hypothetical protein